MQDSDRDHNQDQHHLVEDLGSASDEDWTDDGEDDDVNPNIIDLTQRRPITPLPPPTPLLLSDIASFTGPLAPLWKLAKQSPTTDPSLIQFYNPQTEQIALLEVPMACLAPKLCGHFGVPQRLVGARKKGSERGRWSIKRKKLVFYLEGLNVEEWTRAMGVCEMIMEKLGEDVPGAVEGVEICKTSFLNRDSDGRVYLKVQQMLWEGEKHLYGAEDDPYLAYNLKFGDIPASGYQITIPVFTRSSESDRETSPEPEPISDGPTATATATQPDNAPQFLPSPLTPNKRKRNSQPKTPQSKRKSNRSYSTFPTIPCLVYSSGGAFIPPQEYTRKLTNRLVSAVISLCAVRRGDWKKKGNEGVPLAIVARPHILRLVEEEGQVLLGEELELGESEVMNGGSDGGVEREENVGASATRKRKGKATATEELQTPKKTPTKPKVTAKPKTLTTPRKTKQKAAAMSRKSTTTKDPTQGTLKDYFSVRQKPVAEPGAGGDSSNPKAKRRKTM
ncbi:hypothetical protein BJ165DRAFT_1515920 [Panaeolus papilionaceus]|nr:hypothetical protein BJ165DRAFT_1515920 [Panaeolus papilionaceus]